MKTKTVRALFIVLVLLMSISGIVVDASVDCSDSRYDNQDQTDWVLSQLQSITPSFPVGDFSNASSGDIEGNATCLKAQGCSSCLAKAVRALKSKCSGKDAGSFTNNSCEMFYGRGER